MWQRGRYCRHLVWMGDRNVVKYTGGHRATLITETNHSNLGLKILKIEAKTMMNKSSRLSIKACNPDGRGITDDRCVYLGRHQQQTPLLGKEARGWRSTSHKARAAWRSGSRRHQLAFRVQACLLSPEKIFTTSKTFQTQVAAINLGQGVPTKLKEMPSKPQVSASAGILPELENG